MVLKFKVFTPRTPETATETGSAELVTSKMYNKSKTSAQRTYFSLSPSPFEPRRERFAISDAGPCPPALAASN
eukprot:scaffold5055_cov58-Phaeocystis_antarctica.AAC.4